VTIELPRGPRYGDRLTVTIQGVSPNGRGYGYVEARIGPQREERRYKVEVRKAMPGDVIDAVVEGRKRLTLEARIGEVLEPSPNRREARCQHFGPREEPGRGCGGCTLQALDYAHQLQAKRALVKNLLGRDDVAPPIGAVSQWYYRNKMELTFGDDRTREFALGLRPTGWHREVVQLRECHLMDPKLIGAVQAVRAWAADKPLDWLIQLTVRTGKRTGERLLELVTTHAPLVGEVPAESVVAGFAEVAEPLAQSVWWTQERAVRGERTSWNSHHLAGAQEYNEELHLPSGQVLRLAVPLRAFFQPNPMTAERIVEVIVGELGDEQDLNLVDLYCGTGTMGLALAPSLRRVVGVEIIADAVEAARRNATANGLDNAHYLVGDCAKVLGSEAFTALIEGDTPDVVLVDPPRAGLQGKALPLTASIGAPRIVYVSCGPKALARDLRAFAEHGYEAERIQPVDLFPQTHHIENVAFLRKTSES